MVRVEPGGSGSRQTLLGSPGAGVRCGRAA